MDELDDQQKEVLSDFIKMTRQAQAAKKELKPIAIEALRKLHSTIRSNPDTHQTICIQQFLLSCWNQDHQINVWNMQGLDFDLSQAVSSVFAGVITGTIGENELRETIDLINLISEKAESGKVGTLRQKALVELTTQNMESA